MLLPLLPLRRRVQGIRRDEGNGAATVLNTGTLWLREIRNVVASFAVCAVGD